MDDTPSDPDCFEEKNLRSVIAVSEATRAALGRCRRGRDWRSRRDTEITTDLRTARRGLQELHRQRPPAGAAGRGLPPDVTP